jgi:hypothetical protein
MLVLFVKSRFTASEKARHHETSPEFVSLTALRTGAARYPANRRFSSDAGERKRNGYLVIKQRVAVVLHLLIFPPF